MKKLMEKAAKKPKKMSAAHKAKMSMVEELRDMAMKMMAGDAKEMMAAGRPDSEGASITVIAKKKGETRDASEDDLEKAMGPKDHEDYASDMSTDEEYDDGLGSSDNAKAKMSKIKKRLSELKK